MRECTKMNLRLELSICVSVSVGGGVSCTTKTRSYGLLVCVGVRKMFVLRFEFYVRATEGSCIHTRDQ